MHHTDNSFTFSPGYILYKKRFFRRRIKHHTSDAVALFKGILQFKIELLSFLYFPDLTAVADVENIVVNGVAANVSPPVLAHAVLVEHLHHEAGATHPDYLCFEARGAGLVATKVD